jgi:phosphomannomutase
MTLMLGVSGVRGLVGKTMTPELATDMGRAFGTHLSGGRVVVGRDSRRSGEQLQNALTDGLLQTGCAVIDLGVAPTPGIGHMVERLGADGGVVITASHNPIEWNGIKFLEPPGAAPPAETANKIIAIYTSRRFRHAPAPPDALSHDETAEARHVDRVLGLVPRAAISARQFRVVLDSVNGAGCRSGRALLEALGCHVIHLNGQPTGEFSHPPEPLAENLSGLCDAVRVHGADIGFAQDPDADRLAVVDETGRFIGEEYTLALAAELTFRHRPGIAVANLATSRMIDDIAARHPGCSVSRTPVGEANVVQGMRKHNATIGGEGNGGVIDPRVVFIRDSLISMALVLQLLSETEESLSNMIEQIPRYEMIKQAMALPADRIPDVLERIRGSVTDARVDDRDGVRLDWADGWALARASNTEPIIRVSAEAASRTAAEALIRRLRTAAGDLLA